MIILPAQRVDAPKMDPTVCRAASVPEANFPHLGAVLALHQSAVGAALKLQIEQKSLANRPTTTSS